MVLAALFAVSLFPATAWAGAEVGQVPLKVELKDNLGGRLDGKPWSSDVLAFDKSGKVIFRKDGKLTSEEIQKLVKVIKDNL
jgi:hypothetical protein